MGSVRDGYGDGDKSDLRQVAESESPREVVAVVALRTVVVDFCE